MHTRIIKIDENNIDIELLREAADIIKAGGLVAFPTETVYGLGANALDSKAAKRIYEAKGRPSDNPLIAHIARLEDIKAVSDDTNPNVEKLSNAFWPGPLTMIVNKNDNVPYETTGGLGTVAVRMPSNKIARKLIELSRLPIAAPSANTSGRPSPTRAEHVIEDMDGRIDMIIDGGDVGIGVESTIVDLTSDIPMILRPGAITKKMLENVLGKISLDPSLGKPMADNIKPKAPGMKYRHYAPKAELILVEGSEESVVAAINEKAEAAVKNGIKVGIIATDETKDRYNSGMVLSIGSRNSEADIAHNLYATLRSFDSENVELIYSESFSSIGLGYAIMNRLTKAAGYNTINV